MTLNLVRLQTGVLENIYAAFKLWDENDTYVEKLGALVDEAKTNAEYAEARYIESSKAEQ